MSDKRVPERHELPEELTWDLTDNYANIEAWEEAFADCEKLVKEAEQFKGTLSQGSDKLLSYLVWSDEANEKISRLYNYAHLLRDQDARHTKHLEMHQRASSLIRQFSVATSWDQPELLMLDEETLKRWIEAEAGLTPYAHSLEVTSRMRPHTLSEAEENLLAASGEVLGSGATIFSAMNDADLRFPTVTNEDGEEVELTQGLYGRLLESDDRKVREEAFRAILGTYHSFGNTFAATLGSTVKQHVFTSEARGFASPREAAVYQNAIPETVYQTLLDTVGKHTSLLHRYVGLRKKILGIEDIRPFDLYVPLVKDIDLKFTYEEAQELIIQALAPLGEDYQNILKECFDQRWIDVLENRGKRSGAYSSGCYGTNPHILLNWNGTLAAVFTLAHELGHSLHSYLTWKHQPVTYSWYGIFLAEIASTTNENLLTSYLLKTYEDPEVQAFVVNHYLDGFKGTVFRQTQFAEFEHEIHRLGKERQPITSEGLSELYGRINQKYYGPELTVDEAISHEWMRIPHFYYNFYVYQYATGFSAATAFAKSILEEGQPAVDRYLSFLSAGSSDYPIETLKKAGVDMTTSAPIEAALKQFEDYLDRFETMMA